ncbi:hypothetical protein AK812_SmicGene20336 [Symbiodinium microadriaticum]|uniref:Uncharacterized protein n=1 Tax=Symbiodinium microadriaticum TaxID=2951 RepID=A0A1Q9DQ83_SYMMI|nr:hypothetical protein AK812_SmicGene20336 [Symbiodinium microadriaticum]
MPEWHSRRHDQPYSSSYHSSRGQWYGHGGKGAGKGHGKHQGNSQRFSPYSNGRGGGLEQAVSRSFQTALSSTLERAISEGFAMLTSRLTNGVDQQQLQQHSSPPARAGSTLTRAIVGFVGGTNKETTEAKPSLPATSSEATDANNAALQMALEQQSQTMQLMMDFMKTSQKRGGDAKVVTTSGTTDSKDQKDEAIKQLQEQGASLAKQLAEKSNQASASTTSKNLRQTELPFKPAPGDLLWSLFCGCHVDP